MQIMILDISIYVERIYYRRQKTKTEGIQETALSPNLLRISGHPSIFLRLLISIKIKLSLLVTLDCFIICIDYSFPRRPRSFALS